jgi:FkbM family methyltransferase
VTTTKQQAPLSIVDGAIARADDSSLLQRASRLPLMRWQPVRHAGSARKLGMLVRETVSFAGADLLGLEGVRRYHLRHGGHPVLLRHGTVDIWTFAELFDLRLYEPPAVVERELRAAAEPLIVDLGANIGLFGVDMLVRFPGARVVGYEPEAENAGIHRRLIEITGNDRWTLVEACAGPEAGTVAFLPGQETGSRVIEAAGAGSVEVPMLDVLPLLGEADLVKLDIEGGEWPILADDRFSAVKAAVVEYHPHGCPGDDPRRTAHELLEAHGFDVAELFYEPDSRVGMVWATRS